MCVCVYLCYENSSYTFIQYYILILNVGEILISRTQKDYFYSRLQVKDQNYKVPR